MNILSLLPVQLRTLWPTIALVLCVSAALAGTVLLVHAWKGVPIFELTMDPTAVMDMPPYLGFFSQVGLFAWAASAAICIFSAMIVSRSGGEPAHARFLQVSGLLTIMLGIDDAFMLHEYVFPHFGVAQELVVLAYGIFVLIYLARFHARILQTPYLLLAMAFFFFTLSVAVDQDLIAVPGINYYLLEDGAKLVGIISWLAYFFRTGTAAILRRERF